MFEELLDAVFVHLNGGDVLLLLDVHVCDVEPHVAEVSGRLANLQLRGSRLAKIRECKNPAIINESGKFVFLNFQYSRKNY